jgi:hypothetical protein
MQDSVSPRVQMAKKKAMQKTVEISQIKGMAKDYVTVQCDVTLGWSVVDTKGLEAWCLAAVGVEAFEAAFSTIIGELVLNCWQKYYAFDEFLLRSGERGGELMNDLKYIKEKSIERRIDPLPGFLQLFRLHHVLLEPATEEHFKEARLEMLALVLYPQVLTDIYRRQ